MLGYVHRGQQTMIIHSIKICNVCNVCNFMRDIIVFGINQIRNFRNLMRINCFGINFIFVTVFIFARMVPDAKAAVEIMGNIGENASMAADESQKTQVRQVIADILTQGHFTRDEWNNLLCLFNISQLSRISACFAASPKGWRKGCKNNQKRTGLWLNPGQRR